MYKYILSLICLTYIVLPDLAAASPIFTYGLGSAAIDDQVVIHEDKEYIVLLKRGEDTIGFPTQVTVEFDSENDDLKFVGAPEVELDDSSLITEYPFTLKSDTSDDVLGNLIFTFKPLRKDLIGGDVSLVTQRYVLPISLHSVQSIDDLDVILDLSEESGIENIVDISKLKVTQSGSTTEYSFILTNLSNGTINNIPFKIDQVAENGNVIWSHSTSITQELTAGESFKYTGILQTIDFAKTIQLHFGNKIIDAPVKRVKHYWYVIGMLVSLVGIYIFVRRYKTKPSI